MVPGRSATLRANTRKELAATAVIAVPLAEASVKARAGGPDDEPEDVAAGTWAGVVPLTVASRCGRADQDGPVPEDVGAGWPTGRHWIGCGPWSAPWSSSSPTAYAVDSRAR